MAAWVHAHLVCAFMSDMHTCWVTKSEVVFHGLHDSSALQCLHLVLLCANMILKDPINMMIITFCYMGITLVTLHKVVSFILIKAEVIMLNSIIMLSKVHTLFKNLCITFCLLQYMIGYSIRVNTKYLTAVLK